MDPSNLGDNEGGYLFPPLPTRQGSSPRSVSMANGSPAASQPIKKSVYPMDNRCFPTNGISRPAIPMNIRQPPDPSLVTYRSNAGMPPWVFELRHSNPHFQHAQPQITHLTNKSQGKTLPPMDFAGHTASYTPAPPLWATPAATHIPSTFTGHTLVSSSKGKALSPSHPPSHHSRLSNPSRVDVQQHNIHYSRSPDPRLTGYEFPSLPPNEPRLDQGNAFLGSVQSSNPEVIASTLDQPSYASVLSRGTRRSPKVQPPNNRPSTSQNAIPVTVRPVQTTNQSPNSSSSGNKGPTPSSNRVENWVMKECRNLPPDLRALFITIIRSSCLVDGQLEPIHGSQVAEGMRREVSSQGHQIPVTKKQAGKSIYFSFVNGSQCLICGSNKGPHALECVRKHMRHRAFVCTADGCDTCNGNPRQGFYEYSRLKEHLDRPEQQVTCGHCKRSFRKDNQKRHSCAMMRRF